MTKNKGSKKALNKSKGLLLIGVIPFVACRFNYELISDDDPVALGSGGWSAGGESNQPTQTGGASGGDQGFGGDGGGPGGEAGVPQDWWDEDFRSRTLVEVDTSGAASTLTDFPISVVLDESTFPIAAAGPGGASLRFLSSDQTTVLAHEVEHWDEAGVCVIWVKVPLLDANQRSLWLYFDNPDAASVESESDVWSNEFLGVWHMNGSSNDSSPYGHHGNVSGAIPAEAAFAQGYSFDGQNDAVAVGSPTDLRDLFSGGATLSLWMQPAGFGTSTWPRLLDKAGNVTALEGWALQLEDGLSPEGEGGFIFEHDFDGALGRWDTPLNLIRTGEAFSVAITYDAQSPTTAPMMYVNGAGQAMSQLNAPAGAPRDDSAHELQFGNHAVDASRPFEGLLDEVRISGVERSGDWLLVEHRSMMGTLTSPHQVESLD